MSGKIVGNATSGLRILARRVFAERGAWKTFHSADYLRHNARRLEHLASLRIAVAGLKVLEVGAGIGDHSQYYIDRGCRITITEARLENLRVLRKRYPSRDVQLLDLEKPGQIGNGPFDVVHCYGLLYHVANPEQVLEYLSANCSKLLLLETCVSFGEESEIHLVSEPHRDPSQARSGTGCRPTRPWLFNKLAALFEHVYCPETQPNHEEFPLDWSSPETHRAALSRAVFIASREEIDNQLLSPVLRTLQRRHE